MTELEQIKAIFDRAGVRYRVDTAIGGGTSIQIKTDYGIEGVDVELNFAQDGRLGYKSAITGKLSRVSTWPRGRRS